jgi:hypothetical protein
VGIIVNDGDSQPLALHGFTLDVTKANPYKDGATGRFTTGGGGGGGGKTNPRQNPFTGEPAANGVNPFTGTTQREEKLVQAREELDNNIVGAKRILDNAKNADDADLARGAVKGFKDVQGALGDKKAMGKIRTKRNALAGQLMSPNAALQSDYRTNYGYVQATTSALAIYGNL